MKKCFLPLTAAVACFILAACASVEYQGESLPALSSDTPVKFYLVSELDKMPGVIVLGTAEIVHDWCLPWATGERCKRCYRVCPSQYRAIKRDKQGRPSVDPEKCVGCGAREKACLKPEDGSLAPEANLRAIMVKPI